VDLPNPGKRKDKSKRSIKNELANHQNALMQQYMQNMSAAGNVYAQKYALPP